MKNTFTYFCLCILGIISCKKSGKDTVVKCVGSYSVHIKSITASKCALQGCHGAGSSLGDFSKYTDLKQRADSGWIQHYVFELKIMPPANAVQLTDEEKQQLKCWLDNGAPLD